MLAHITSAAPPLHSYASHHTSPRSSGPFPSFTPHTPSPHSSNNNSNSRVTTTYSTAAARTTTHPSYAQLVAPPPPPPQPSQLTYSLTHQALSPSPQQQQSPQTVNSRLPPTTAVPSSHPAASLLPSDLFGSGVATDNTNAYPNSRVAYADAALSPTNSGVRESAPFINAHPLAPGSTLSYLLGSEPSDVHAPSSLHAEQSASSMSSWAGMLAPSASHTPPLSSELPLIDVSFGLEAAAAAIGPATPDNSNSNGSYGWALVNGPASHNNTETAAGTGNKAGWMGNSSAFSFSAPPPSYNEVPAIYLM